MSTLVATDPSSSRNNPAGLAQGRISRARERDKGEGRERAPVTTSSASEEDRAEAPERRFFPIGFFGGVEEEFPVAVRDRDLGGDSWGLGRVERRGWDDLGFWGMENVI